VIANKNLNFVSCCWGVYQIIDRGHTLASDAFTGAAENANSYSEKEKLIEPAHRWALSFTLLIFANDAVGGKMLETWEVCAIHPIEQNQGLRKGLHWIACEVTEDRQF
jgi:hypothetical protein